MHNQDPELEDNGTHHEGRQPTEEHEAEIRASTDRGRLARSLIVMRGLSDVH
ncbi:MAG: hypothetical protein M3P14_10280 [Chloroflexota bacterium]|nr:hypothetical protein [Chloroflexota bacterium]